MTRELWTSYVDQMNGNGRTVAGGQACLGYGASGGRGFICSRSPRPRCACGKVATIQCDSPVTHRNGTCDRHLCASCATELGPDLHVCPKHTAANLPGAVQQSLEF